MNQTEIRTVCTACAADLTRQDRYRDHDGQYFCLPCHRARLGASAEGPFKEALRQCVFCETWVARPDCHRNRYGEYVCLECRGSGRRWSRRRIVQRRLRHWFVRCRRVLFVLLASVVGLWVAYVVLGKVIELAIPRR